MKTPMSWVLRVVLLLAAAALMGVVVMLLWNAVLPALFEGARTIGYLHAMGLLVLSRILFGGFRGHGGCDWHSHRQHRHALGMTAEERAACRRGPWSRAGHQDGTST